MGFKNIIFVGPETSDEIVRLLLFQSNEELFLDHHSTFPDPAARACVGPEPFYAAARHYTYEQMRSSYVIGVHV